VHDLGKAAVPVGILEKTSLTTEELERFRLHPYYTERALSRVAHESLGNAWRHARCSVVRIALSFDESAVTLTVTDDGTGLTESIPDRGRVGTSSMRRAVNEAGGTFRMRNGRPRGTVVEAEVPRERR
jgi:signal transduction histidine kinase